MHEKRARTAVLLTALVLLTPARVKAEEPAGTVILHLNEPLEGRTFALYQIRDADGNLTGSFRFLQTENDIEPVEQTEQILVFIAMQEESWFENDVQTVSDAETITGLEEGQYLIRQIRTPEGYKPVQPFLIDIPVIDAEGNKTYAVKCSPKVMKEEKEKPHSSEKSRTGLSADPSVLHGTILILGGLAAFAIQRIIRRHRNETT